MTSVTTDVTARTLDELVTTASELFGPLFGAAVPWRVVRVEAEPVVADALGVHAWRGAVTAEVTNGVD